jgi:hypothetical protein
LRKGPEREPHFAHAPGEESQECEEYHPGNGTTNVGGATKVNRPEVEDSGDSLGLCLEVDGSNWNLYLRLPEIPNDELGAASLTALSDAKVAISAGTFSVRVLPAFELRPGVGSARALVPPISDSYSIIPRGKWPHGVNLQRWHLSSNGLSVVGTLFRFSRGEWVRLRPESLVEWGEHLSVVADSHASPPRICLQTPSKKVHSNGLDWQCWQITLPRQSDAKVEQWLEHLGHPVSAPTCRIRILSIPDSFDSETQLPYFTHGTPIVGKLIAPFAGGSYSLMLSYESNRTSIPVRLNSESPEVFFELSVSTAGECTLQVDDESEGAAEFHCIEPMTIESLRQALDQLPRLRLSIGDKHFKSWTGETSVLTLPHSAGDPEVHIDLGVEQARVSLSFHSANDHLVRTELPPREAERLINQALSQRQPGELRIDAGALGSLFIPVEFSEKTAKPQPVDRVAAWLSSVMSAQSGETALAKGPTVTRRMIGNAHLLFASTRNATPALTTQFRAMAKRLHRSRQRNKR